MLIYYYKYSDGFGSGHCYYTTKKQNDQLLEIYEVDKDLLEMNKHKFDNVSDLIEAALEVQEYRRELASIGIKI